MTAIENAPVTGSLAELVMVTVGAAVFAVMENWSAAALGFPELSCAAPAAMSTVTVPETSGVIVAVCKVAGFTAGRGEPRHRATGIVGQLPRVRGQTPGLPPRGGRARRRILVGTLAAMPAAWAVGVAAAADAAGLETQAPAGDAPSPCSSTNFVVADVGIEKTPCATAWASAKCVVR